jgi:hypothetical protein
MWSGLFVHSALGQKSRKPHHCGGCRTVHDD